MSRMVAFVVLALFVASCNLFVPDARLATDDDNLVFQQYRAGQTRMVRYMFVPTEIDARETLARCLTERGVVLYSTTWCGPCQRQKALFGPFVELLTNVDCTTERERCRAAGVRGVPTWIFPDGTRNTGGLSLQQLAERAGCSTRGL